MTKNKKYKLLKYNPSQNQNGGFTYFTDILSKTYKIPKNLNDTHQVVADENDRIVTDVLKYPTIDQINNMNEINIPTYTSGYHIDDLINYESQLLQKNTIYNKPNVILLETYSIGCLKYLREMQNTNKTVIMNFANAFKICGAHYSSSAQEETLCRSAPLLYYELSIYKKREELENGNVEYTLYDPELYTNSSTNTINVTQKWYDKILYTENMDFIRDDYGNLLNEQLIADIITVAALDRRYKFTGYNMTDQIYFDGIYKSLEATFLLPLKYGVKNIILGAWGLGVFENDEVIVIEGFINAIDKYGKYYDNIFFPLDSNWLNFFGFYLSKYSSGKIKNTNNMNLNLTGFPDPILNKIELPLCN